MHFDLAHAVVTVALLLATQFALLKTGVIGKDDKQKFNWKSVVAMTLVVFVLNLIWPPG